MNRDRRIGILTLYYKNQNFGGLLQAYALQKAVEKNSGACDQICYMLSATPFRQKLQNSMKDRPLLENLQMLYRQVSGAVISKISAKTIHDKCKERRLHFSEFEHSIPHSKCVYDYNSIQNLDDYDAYITGSDQVWNGGVDLPSFALQFVPDGTRKISYAASAASVRFGEWHTRILKENLQRFDKISVREQSMANTIEKICGLSVDVVADPVFLLSKEEWETVCEYPDISEPYILCYLLGTNKDHRNFAKRVAKQNGCKIVSFPYIVGNKFRSCDRQFGDLRDFSSGPREFLGLIHNAQAVVTDSFHAAAFSVIFEKKVWALPRFHSTKGGPSNHRITDLLQEYGMMECFVEDCTSCNDILISSVMKYDVKSILEKNRLAAIKYLEVALGGSDAE